LESQTGEKYLIMINGKFIIDKLTSNIIILIICPGVNIFTKITL